jgi:TetR/AcrR family tetracycline transcriptional repressor
LLDPDPTAAIGYGSSLTTRALGDRRAGRERTEGSTVAPLVAGGDSGGNRRSVQLSREQIVEAALSIVQESGLESLSMRRLSKKLGVSTMAPYYYVDDKNGLIELVVEAVLSTVAVPGPEAGPWDVRLRLLIDAIDAQLRSHPGIGEVLLAGILSAHRELLDAVMELLFEAGFGGRDVLLAYAVLHTYLFGRHKVAMASEHIALDRVGTPDWMVAHLDEVSGRDFYAFGVETIIAGFKARLAEQEAQGARATP